MVSFVRSMFDATGGSRLGGACGLRLPWRWRRRWLRMQ